MGTAPDRPQIRLLVVDDHPEEFTLIEAAIVAMGFEPVLFTATTAPLAVVALSTAPVDERPRVALVDINMPLVSGFELAAILERDGVPTYLISNQVDGERISQAADIGAHGIHRKPGDIDGYVVLLECILAALPAEPCARSDS